MTRDGVPRAQRRGVPRHEDDVRTEASGNDPVGAVCLFGVAAGHRNLGVGALRAAAAAELLKREPACRITVFDEGWGQRPGRVLVAGRWVPVELCGVRNSRRLHRRESYLNMRLSAALGGLGNPGLARIDAADAVFDISGGDSFSDIYGEHRFRTVAWPKRLAVLRRRPLVLLPQTYGPFRSPRLRAEAAGLLRAAAMAWARDDDSYQAMLELLGDDADPARHRPGVDVAFALEPREPGEEVRDALLGVGEGDRAGELFALLNPINHVSTRAGLHKYKVEPYVAAGDVYAVWPHTGRGGWTWYTGSAGWMYQ